MGERILVVDDDLALSEMIGIVLRAEGYEPEFCGDGAAALGEFRRVKPELVLLDVMLPGLDGIQICHLLRAESGMPIIMLTAKSDTTDVVRGLEAGADDYIVKPFNPKELVARIKTRLRASQPEVQSIIRVGDLTLNVNAHEVLRGEEQINLTPLEFDLLCALAAEPGTVRSRDVLMREVWGWADASGTRTLDSHVKALRAKIGADRVRTVHGVGYALEATP